MVVADAAEWAGREFAKRRTRAEEDEREDEDRGKEKEMRNEGTAYRLERITCEMKEREQGTSFPDAEGMKGQKKSSAILIPSGEARKPPGGERRKKDREMRKKNKNEKK